MSRVYDNWERLVAAVMKKQQLWELFHQHSRTPSTCSESSSTSFKDVSFDFSRLKEELKIKKASTDQIVAVKQIGLQGNRECLVEVLMLSLLHHPNMLNLIGYCADGDHRLLVHEYMPFGSLDDHLHGLQPEKALLDWNTRIKIAVGVAKCLAYMHETANPPFIHQNVTSSNILLGQGYHPKLSHFGLAKLGPVGDETQVFTTVKGTYGYCAPEYAMTGRLTVKADVYSYGIVLLEIITGRKAIDNSRAVGETDLVLWNTEEITLFDIFDLDERNKIALYSKSRRVFLVGWLILYLEIKENSCRWLIPCCKVGRPVSGSCYCCYVPSDRSRCPTFHGRCGYSHKLHCFPGLNPGCGLKPRSCMLQCCCGSSLGIETWSMSLLLASSNSML